MEGIEIVQARVGARRDIAMLTVKGYVDTMTCSILLNKITELLNQGVLHIIIDMAQVSYVSSAGWGVFVGEIKDIREKGGDLKMVQMTPEVYDVFEMLEFNKILSYYESIEEAINDFDVSIGLDITKSVVRTYTPASPQASSAVPEVVARPVAKSPTSEPVPQTGSQKPQVDQRLLPLTEKIKLAIIEDPRRGLFKLRKALRSPQYGSVKIGPWKLYRILKKLNLERSEKRYRFYRSR